MSKKTLSEKIKEAASSAAEVGLQELEKFTDQQKEILEAKARVNACEQRVKRRTARMLKLWPTMTFEEAMEHEATKEVYEALKDEAAERAELEAM